MIKIAFKENYVLQLPENHSFPMVKYELLPKQLVYQGIFELDDFFEPLPFVPIALLRELNKMILLFLAKHQFC